jgi:hypothetical protein
MSEEKKSEDVAGFVVCRDWDDKHFVNKRRIYESRAQALWQRFRCHRENVTQIKMLEENGWRIRPCKIVFTDEELLTDKELRERREEGEK